MGPITCPHALVLHSGGQANFALWCFGVVDRCKQNLTKPLERIQPKAALETLLTLPPIDIEVESSAVKSAVRFLALN